MIDEEFRLVFQPAGIDNDMHFILTATLEHLQRSYGLAPEDAGREACERLFRTVRRRFGDRAVEPMHRWTNWFCAARARPRRRRTAPAFRRLAAGGAEARLHG